MLSDLVDFIKEHNVPCPSCGKHNFTDIRQFNLMFKTFQGVTEDAKNTVCLLYTSDLYIRAQKFTEVLQIHGIMETWA